MKSVNLRNLLIQMLLLTSLGLSAQTCPMVFNPVVGTNGVTYLNSCFAEAASNSFYTKGVSFSGCIDPQLMNPAANCGTTYDPVVGCNGEVYLNACEAQKHGVTSYMPQGAYAMNNGDIDNCFDYQNISNAFPTAFNYSNGTLDINCGVVQEPVCGCDGVTYRNPCAAEASGIIDYTYGLCQTPNNGSCVEPREINMGVPQDCNSTYAPVCGCNGLTYINQCAAEASGVTQVTQGVCNPIANQWQNDAIPISSGNLICDQTTLADGNDISNYSGCTNVPLLGPEKVYVIHKTEPGDLQVLMEFPSTDIDLDIFVINGMTNARCIGQSIAPPGQNIEGVVVENAPIGTYYIVVDAQYANVVGEYCIQASTGYLNTTNAVELDCGVPMATNNSPGENNLIAFTCGNFASPNLIQNAPGSGPEMVYTFTTNQDGQVSVDLFNLAADMNMYLVSELDRSNCVGFSANRGTSTENITMFLQAGTYFVIVDGQMGATGDYMLNVSCPSSCEMHTQTFATNTDCNTASGTIRVSASEGNNSYWYSIEGPVSRTGGSTDSSYQFTNLPSGMYEVYTLDMYGCMDREEVPVYSGLTNFMVTAAAGTNQINLTMVGGAPPFQIFLNGNLIGTTSNTTYTIPNVVAGQYEVEVVDATNCPQTSMMTMSGLTVPTCNMTITAVPMGATCTGQGNISVDVYNGQAPFTATINGVSTGQTYNATWFSLPNLAPGTYTVVITDANNCTATQTVTVANNTGTVAFTANGINASCGGGNGSVTVNITAGNSPFTATLNGAVAGTYTANNFTIPNVAPGTYTLEITDNWSCSSTATVTVGAGGSISINPTVTNATCGSAGSISVGVTGGAGPYTATLNGNAAGTYTTASFTIPNVGAGTYNLVVTDANGCSDNTNVTVTNTGGNLTVTANPTSGSCSVPGSIAVDVTGGTGPYVVTLNGAAAGTYTNSWFTLTNIAPGTYTVLVTDANGCTGTVSTTVGSAGGNITVTANPTSGSCNVPGSIAVDVIGGTAPYTVTLNGNGAGTYQNNWFNLQNVAPGTYTLLVTDGNGCTGTTTITVGGGGGFTITATPTNGSCGTTASIAVSVNGGTAPFMVSMNGVVVGNTSQNPFTISNVTSGSYTLSITDANGCTSSTPVTVTGGTNKKLIVSATTTGASCGSGGSIQLDILGGTPNFDVFLNGNLVTNTNNRWYIIQNVPAGTHTVKVVDANGCEHTITRTVTGTGGNITVTANQTTVACGSTGTVAITVAGGSTPYTVFVNGNNIGTSNQTAFNIVNLSAGSYNITIQGANGCSGSAPVTVSGSNKKFAVTGTVNSATGCSTPGSVQLDILGGVAPFDVYVDGNLVTNTTNRWYIIQNLTPGTYTIRVVDANGCEDTITKTVGGSSGGNISLTATTTNAGCNGGGTIALDIIGGTAPFDVELDGTLVTNTSDRWFTITNVTAGSHTVKVTDANGCMATINKTVTGGGNITLTTTATGGTCSSNGSVQVDINGGAAPYDIELDGNFVATTSDNWYTIPNVAPGSHTIKVTDKNGCMSTKTIHVTTSNSNLFVGATSTPGNCSGGGTIMLDITGGTAPFDVELNGTFIVQTNDRWYTIQNVAAGAYDIKVTDANGCMGTHHEIVQNTGSGGVTIVANPTAATCSGNGSIAIDITAGDAPFDIELDGNFVATTMDNWYVISNVAPGDHTVKVTDKHGCMSSVSTTVGTSGSNISLTANVTAATCSTKGAIHLDIAGGDAPFDIDLDGTFLATTSDNLYNISDLAAGDYSIKVTDKHGCTATKDVTVTGTGSDITLDPDITDSSCGLDNGILKFRINGGTAPFDVFVDGTLEKDGVNARNQTFRSVGAGDYLVKVVDKNGCEEEATLTVGGSDPIVFTSTVVNAGCSGSKGSIEIDITSGTSPFEVFLDGGSVAVINNRSYTFDNLDAGNYEVKVIDDNGCVLTEDLKITGGSSNLKMTATPTDASCDDDGTIAVDVTGGDAPFEIYVDGNLVTTTSDRWYTVTDLGAGIYMVRVVDANGCEDTSNEKIDGGSTLTARGTITNAACGQNGAINVIITGGDAPYEIYVDGNLETTTSDLTYAISNLAPARYAIRVVDANGCEVTFNRNVRGSGSNVSFIGTPTACGCGQTNGKIDVAITGGTAPYDVFVDGVLFGSTVSNDLTVTGLAPGNYDIRVVDADGCEDTNTVAVTQATGVSVTTTSTACGCNGITGTIAVDLTGGTAPYDIFLDGNYITSTTNSTYVIGGLAAGTYTVKAVDANNCEDSVTEDVLHFADLDFTISSTGAGCGMMNGSITVDITAGVAPFSIYSNGNLVATTSDNSYTIDNLPAGAYLIRVVDDNTCDDTQNVTITGSSSNISINATAFPENCGAMDGNIALDVTGGTEPFDIYLDGVLIANTTDRWYNINDLVPGTYTVRVVDANGCEASQTLTVTGNSSINTSTSPTNSACSQMNGTITVDNSGGLAPYTIFLNGNDVGTTFNQLFTVAGLNPGTYDIRVEDANGCFAETQETVGGGGALSFTTSTTDESCGTPGQIKVDITAGAAPIEIYLDGNLVTSTSGNSFDITGLSSASYDVRLIDAAGCEETAKVTVGGSALLDFNVIAQPDNCGDNGSALVNITNGAAPFTIELDGVQVTTTNDRSYTITSLISGGYVVKVTDSQGCTDEIVVMINNTGQAPLAEFTFMFRPGGVVKFFSNNSAGNLSWDFDDGSTSTDANPIHTFTVGNTYKVCLTATNSCGTDTYCETLMVPTVYTSNLTFKTPPSSGREGDIIEVPVYVDNFDRVTSFQYSIKLGDKNRAHLLDIINDQLTDVEYELVDEETVTIKWESDDPNGISRPDDFKIFDLRIQLNGARGECTPIEFVTDPMMIEVYQKWFADPTMVMPNFFNGEVCISNMVNVVGNVHRADHKAVPNVEVTCNNSQSQMNDSQTGDFQFEINSGNSCLILPVKDGDDYMALTILDLLAMRRHMTQAAVFDSPYKIIAADMNRDQLVNGNDLGIVADLVLGNQTDMVHGDSWRFMPADWTFTDPTQPFAPLFPVMINLPIVNDDSYNNDFIGMKLGDVDYSLDMNTMSDKDYAMAGQLNFEVADRSVGANEEFVLEVKSSDFNNVCGFQFQLDFDPAAFEFVEMLPGALVGLDHNMVGNAFAQNGTITMLWYDRALDPNGISTQSDDVVFRLKFKALQARNTIANQFNVGQSLLHDMGTDVFENMLHVNFGVEGQVSSTTNTNDVAFKLHQNYPNPFSKQTIIGFELPTPQDVQFELIDQSGRTVLSQNAFYPQGYQQIIVKGQDLPVSGVYFYRLRVADTIQTNKLIFMR